MSEQLFDKGIVKDSFKKEILKREKNFPTGLKTNSFGVAIPHTDAVNVNRDQIAISRLKEPVIFKQMGDGSEVKVKLIFMLALKESHSQLSMLQKLMNIFQNSSLMEKLYKSKNEKEIIRILAINGIE